MEFEHKSVLLYESIESLNIKSDGIYVDATAGGGGHSAQILARLNENGRLILIDRDPDAIETLTNRFNGDSRVRIVQNQFSAIKSILSELDVPEVDGILADLGVSSHQLDTAQRGFSFHTDAPLDMRMSQTGRTAADIVNTYSYQQLSSIIFRYGEEKFSRRIADKIIEARRNKPIETTFELVDIIKDAIPAAARRSGGHPARRTFQALRIETNGELDELSAAIEDMFSALAEGGRLSIITFHSLEDRAVKQYFSSLLVGCTCPPEFPVCVCGGKPRGLLPFKSRKPSEMEIQENPRSRSAMLRTVEKA